MKASYGKFLAMVVVSTLVMFTMMYFNTYRWEHVFFSETRAYMALMMGGMMAIIMLAFMWTMYPNAKTNAVILALAAVVFVVSLWLVRSQATVRDVAWMKGMIPHHSIAILTSSRATLTDPRVRDLAANIISTQEREIGEMKNLVAELDRR